MSQRELGGAGERGAHDTTSPLPACGVCTAASRTTGEGRSREGARGARAPPPDSSPDTTAPDPHLSKPGTLIATWTRCDASAETSSLILTSARGGRRAVVSAAFDVVLFDGRDGCTHRQSPICGCRQPRRKARSCRAAAAAPQRLCCSPGSRASLGRPQRRTPVLGPFSDQGSCLAERTFELWSPLPHELHLNSLIVHPLERWARPS